MPPPLPPIISSALPFPYPLRIGTDICRVARVARILRGRRAARFIRRVLAPEELAHARPAVRAVLDAAGGAPAAGAAVAGGVVGRRDGSGGGSGGGAGGGTLSGQGGSTRARGAGVVEENGERVEEIGEEGLKKDAVSRGLGQRRSLYSEDGAEDGDLYERAGVFLAGRWAAKEAAFKAHPHLRLGFHDVLILTGSQVQERQLGDETSPGRPDRAPVAVIKPGGQGDGGPRDQMAMVSISHDGDYATAVCIGFDQALVERAETRRPKQGWFTWFSRLWS